MGKKDKQIRGAIGTVAILSGAWFGCGLIAIVGVVFIATSTLSFCPAYPLLKIDTLDKQEKVEEVEEKNETVEETNK
jgi:hypothetical protein